MHVKDIMTFPAHTVRADAPLGDAVTLLEDRSFTAVPVVDDSGALVGMISEVDVLRRRLAGAATGEAAGRVREAMSGLPLSAWPDADVIDVADAMVNRDAHTVPVVVEEHVVGVVSRSDVLRTVLPTQRAAQREAQRRVDVYADGRHQWPVLVRGTVATVEGAFDDDTERTVVEALVRTTMGIDTVRVVEPAG
ncbi:CBS domain-containing protein [Dactylosporangium sp. NPDC051484]|uniref:CBS domain-containing protein n=1 Tax=Dactylosporangium sp. NPDC051484 TaxID=3154942 RepID=UPI00344EC6F1